jgi:hypothetical protein
VRYDVTFVRSPLNYDVVSLPRLTLFSESYILPKSRAEAPVPRLPSYLPFSPFFGPRNGNGAGQCEYAGFRKTRKKGNAPCVPI